MNSKNTFAHKEIDVFYTRWFIRTLLFVVFIFMPLMIEHWIDVTTTEPISSKEAAAALFSARSAAAQRAAEMRTSIFPPP